MYFVLREGRLFCVLLDKLRAQRSHSFDSRLAKTRNNERGAISCQYVLIQCGFEDSLTIMS